MESASSTRSMVNGVAITPKKHKHCDNTTSAPMNKHKIFMRNHSLMAQDDYPQCPPGFELSDVGKYTLDKLERKCHGINVSDPMGVVPDTCPCCAKEGGPCKENEGDVPFFRMKFANENRLYYLIIPCCAHKKFNNIQDRTIKIMSSEGKIYEASLIKVFDKVLLGSSGWQKFVADHGLGRGDEVHFHFQKNEPHLVFGFKPIKDVYNNDEGHNGCETVHPSVHDVSSTKKVVHSATYVSEPSAADEATSHHLYSFIHQFSPSDVKYVLKISKARTDKFQVPPSGEVDLIMRHPRVIVHGKYKIVNGLTHVDGRLSVNHGWKDFVNQTGLKPNMEVKIEASLIHDKLTLHIGPV
ncbi:uncharacterized protein LOC123396202 isoform X1 [Hordeum vulgare subsp. vulgare]|uniref:uncharacterized protein LOC123396202 isoform X1 n=1 Tax=Hordeum vulgare subsp. vulgare TaxID=112509 RepID=UPI000B479DAE|nr:uncharacterized protein LOC123396202 isoform X1 [Hordeum vulgare subsp. vulgare]